MATLAIGRVGLDVTLDHPSTWTDDSRSTSISGFLRSSTTAQANALRTELIDQIDQLVAVTYSGDSTGDGYYILRDVSVNLGPVGQQTTGSFMPFTVTLERIGREAATEMQSLLTILTLSNDHGVDDTEVHPIHAVPAGHYLYEGSAEGISGTTSITRATEDGNVTVYLDVDVGTHPRWGVAPSDFYDGAAYVKTNSRLRTGIDSPLDTTGWELGNGLLKVVPTGGSSQQFQLSIWDGVSAYESATAFKLQTDAGGGGVDIADWTSVHITRNDPEACTIRLMKDKAVTGGAGRHYVDMTLRRGEPMVRCVWSFPESTLIVIRTATDAATAVTPTGASSAVGVEDGAADGNGNKWFLATTKTHTADTTNGGISYANGTQPFPFAMGISDGSSPGDTVAHLMLEYLGAVYETVRAVRR